MKIGISDEPKSCTNFFNIALFDNGRVAGQIVKFPGLKPRPTEQ